VRASHVWQYQQLHLQMELPWRMEVRDVRHAHGMNIGETQHRADGAILGNILIAQAIQ